MTGTLADYNEQVVELRSVLHDVGEERSRPKSALRSFLQFLYWTITLQIFARRKAEDLVRRRMEIVRQSLLFDPSWYETKYPDVVGAGVDPLRHFCEFGVFEARRPGPAADDASLLDLRRQLEHPLD
jgi:hypothetical protein